MFVDTHAHLTDKMYGDNVEEVVNKANQSGVEKIITSSVNIENAKDCVNLTKIYSNVYSSIGIYPEYIYDWNREQCDTLIRLAQDKKVVAIGEIGLQFTADMPDKEGQKEVLVKQMQIAYELRKPIVFHCREAYGAILEIFQKNRQLLKYGGTMHCFNGSKEIAKELLKMGLYISVGGVSTFKNANSLKETLKQIPNENILFETDSPYLTPHPYRGQINMPSFLPTIAQNLSILKDIDVEDLSKLVRENTRRLFGI